MPDEAEKLDGLREDPIITDRDAAKLWRLCQHCGGPLYDGTYKVVLEGGGLSEETYCRHCDGLLWG